MIGKIVIIIAFVGQTYYYEPVLTAKFGAKMNSKCLVLIEYYYDHYEFSKIIAVAPSGANGKSALIHKYIDLNYPDFPLNIDKDNTEFRDSQLGHYAIEEFDYLGLPNGKS
jgi:hypothetical protein